MHSTLTIFFPSRYVRHDHGIPTLSSSTTIEYPVSSAQYPVSSAQYPVSSAQYPVSSAQSRSCLCTDCSNLDFQEILKIPTQGLQRQIEGFTAGGWQEGCHLDWIRSTQGCPLCDVFNQAIINYPGPLGDLYRLTLVWYVAKDYFSLSPSTMEEFKVLGVMFSKYGWWGFDDVPRALLLPTDARRSLAPSIPRGRRISNPINWGILKQWLSDCDEEHSRCVPERKLEVAGMRFIDCETLEIVPSPKPPPPYITLSYLWGRVGDYTEGPLSSGMPLVIEDAIHVVKELGFRYLWVDLYCITQDDGPEMHILISNMDQIYSCAALTVIANNETNANYGLPGVNSISRVLQI